jgi:hypothetical protein
MSEFNAVCLLLSFQEYHRKFVDIQGSSTSIIVFASSIFLNTNSSKTKFIHMAIDIDITV